MITVVIASVMIVPVVMVVFNPCKNARLKKGNKSDWIDAWKVAELLRGAVGARYVQPV